MSREEQKQRLKSNVIDKEEELGKDEKRRLSPLVLLALLVVAALLAYGAYYYYTSNMTEEYSVLWERRQEGLTGTVETFKGYESFADGVIKYTKDGAEYVDHDGRVIWERSYQLNSPVISVSNTHAVIADQGGTSIYIFSKDILTGTSETILPISLVRVSDNGIVYAVLNDSEAEYITAFREDGSAIDLSVKSIVTGDGYPFDISVSPDGSELLTSYAGIENGQIINNVVFRNFSSVGQNEDARRIVGGFSDEFEGHLAGRVHFSTNDSSQAFYDGGVVFFSTKVLNTPEVLEHVRFDDRIDRIDCSKDLVAVMLDTDNGDGYFSKLVIYSNKGVKLGETDLDYRYTDMCITGKCVAVSDSVNIRVYSKRGVLRAALQYDEGELTQLIGTEKSRQLITVSGNDLFRIKY